MLDEKRASSKQPIIKYNKNIFNFTEKKLYAATANVMFCYFVFSVHAMHYPFTNNNPPASYVLYNIQYCDYVVLYNTLGGMMYWLYIHEACASLNNDDSQSPVIAS